MLFLIVKQLGNPISVPSHKPLSIPVHIISHIVNVVEAVLHVDLAPPQTFLLSIVRGTADMVIWSAQKVFLVVSLESELFMSTHTGKLLPSLLSIILVE